MSYKGLSSSQISKLSFTQIAALTAQDWAEFTSAQMSGLTGAQLSHVSATGAGDWTRTQIKGLNPTALAHMSLSSFTQLIAPKVASLTAEQLAGLTAGEVKSLTVNEVHTLSDAQIEELSPQAIAALHGLTQTKALGLNAAALGGLNATEFTKLIAPNLASLNNAQVAGLTDAELALLSPTQALDFTASQLGAMSAEQRATLGSLDPTLADAEAHESGGVLSYDGALAVLQDAAVGGMSQLKFDGLNSVAAAISSGAIQTSAYVEQIFDDVVQGNSANAWWTGGGASRVTLGDLSANSSQTQVDELIGKWFLGTDLPKLDSNYSYQDDSNTPLYGSTGTPQIADINQGASGDCYFLAALGEIAYKDPLTIENMIQANGNGTYSVEFQVNGSPDYVTVNDDFQHLPSGWYYAGGNTAFDGGNGALWSELIEKAFVQLNEQQGAGDYTSVNSYDGISGGWGEGLTEITGQSFNTYSISTNNSASSISNTLKTLQTALSNGEDVIMGTSASTPPAGSNLVDDHMFSVLAVNAAAGTVTLRNPWGGSGATFTDAGSYLAADNVQFLATTGHSALG